MEDEKLINIDGRRILASLWSKKVVVIIVSVLCAAVMFVFTNFLVTPQYKADVLIYVNNNSVSLGGTSITFAQGQLTAARQLLDTYLVILKSRSTLDSVIDKADLPYTRAQLNEMITASAVDETEVFRVVVTSKDPDEAQVIANTIADVLPSILTKTIKGSSVEVIDLAVKPESKAFPNVTNFTAVGFVLGFLISCAYIVLKELFNDKIRDENTLSQMFTNVPILANIPHRHYGNHGDYSKYAYSYGDNNSKKNSQK